MSCGGANPTFRLLDPIVGWDAANAAYLAGIDGEDGIALLPLDRDAVDGDQIAGHLPPPWLAAGCGPCEWYLVTPPAGEHPSRLLHHDACDCGWQPVWPDDCTPLIAADGVAVAIHGDTVALADRAGNRVILASLRPARIAGEIASVAAIAMTFDCRGVLLAAVQGADRLLRFAPGGAPLRAFPATLPVGPVARLAATADGIVWLATPGVAAGTVRLWRATADDAAFTRASLAELRAVRPPGALIAATEDSFCLRGTSPDATAASCCWSRFGSPLAPPPIRAPIPAYNPRGQLLTTAIDSGLPRCVWHRLRIDADIPPGTLLQIAVATAETAYGQAQGTATADWDKFSAGVPHQLDWQEATGATDLLIRQPPGRYLYLRLRLQSPDGVATPLVRRIRLDFPRATSIDLLPAIYRADPDAADFTARFLALFDASISDLDAAIERTPALLDVGGVPDGVLPWLAAFLGLVLDPAWEAQRRRAILRAVPELYRLRGTLAGLKLAFRLVFDIEPAIVERGPQRPWRALRQNAALGSLRLFGRNRTRARLGRAVLGQAVVKSWGDPARDPLDALAYRVVVLLPPAPRTLDLARVQALVDSQKPAHVLAGLRAGGNLFVVGASAAVGIDTGFLPPPAPVLGRAGNVRLSRTTVLRRGRRGSGAIPPGSVVVGHQPFTE